jgi:hypothetical protein
MVCRELESAKTMTKLIKNIDKERGGGMHGRIEVPQQGNESSQ